MRLNLTKLSGLFILLFFISNFLVVKAQPVEIMQKLIADDFAKDDFFGNSVGISGNYAIIGANENDDDGSESGSAYIYKRSGDTWLKEIKLTAYDAASGDEFGFSVAIFGDYAIVGSKYDDDNGENSGSAYIYRNNGGVWEFEDKLIASDGINFDYFGSSVSINNNYAVVGAIYSGAGGANTGTAYVFINNAGNWQEVFQLKAPDGDASDYYGESLNISGDYLIVGAYGDDDSYNRTGSAYIFKNTQGTWAFLQKLNASDPEEDDFFGYSVSLFGNYAIIGAYNKNENGAEAGAAYIFKNISDSWEEQVKLTASDGSISDRFGYSVGIYNDYCVVGSIYDDENGSNTGSVYVYHNESDIWTETIKLTDDGITEHAAFGNAISISGNYAIAGAYRDGGDYDNYGSAFIIGSPASTIFESVNDELSIFPNPTSGILSVLTKDAYKVVISDISGKILKEIHIKSGVTELDMTNQANGIYFIRLENAKEVISSKFIIN